MKAGVLFWSQRGADIREQGLAPTKILKLVANIANITSITSITSIAIFQMDQFGFSLWEAAPAGEW